MPLYNSLTPLPLYSLPPYPLYSLTPNPSPKERGVECSAGEGNGESVSFWEFFFMLK